MHVPTPACLALCASSFPTSVACSDFEPLNDFSARCDADATVRPLRSSTSCAVMPRFERETTRRGRADVPTTRPRTRRCRRSRASRTVKLGTLTNLPAHELALVADPLALVGLGRADLANLCGGLADHLLVGALDDDLRRGRHLEGHAGARLHRHRVGVADLQLEVAALERSAVADTLDLEALLEALGDALDHVRDQCAREPVQRAILAALGRAGHGEGAVVLRDLHALRDVLLKGAERAGHGHAARLQRHGDAGRDFDWSLADSAHVVTR